MRGVGGLRKPGHLKGTHYVNKALRISWSYVFEQSFVGFIARELKTLRGRNSLALHNPCEINAWTVYLLFDSLCRFQVTHQLNSCVTSVICLNHVPGQFKFTNTSLFLLRKRPEASRFETATEVFN